MDAKTAYPEFAQIQDCHLKNRLTERFKTIRNFSHRLVAPLKKAHFVIQAMENFSPTKWYLTHIRKTYRNFFYPDARWQFNGIRLARTV